MPRLGIAPATRRVLLGGDFAVLVDGVRAVRLSEHYVNRVLAGAAVDEVAGVVAYDANVIVALAGGDLVEAVTAEKLVLAIAAVDGWCRRRSRPRPRCFRRDPGCHRPFPFPRGGFRGRRPPPRPRARSRRSGQASRPPSRTPIRFFSLRFLRKCSLQNRTPRERSRMKLMRPARDPKELRLKSRNPRLSSPRWPRSHPRGAVCILRLVGDGGHSVPNSALRRSGSRCENIRSAPLSVR